MFLSHFPGAPAVLGLGKGWAEMRWLCAVLDSLSHDPRTEWNHSLNPFSLAVLAKTIVDPNVHLWATWRIKVYANRKRVDFGGQMYFFWYFLFSPTHFCTQIFTHKVRGQGLTLLAVLAERLYNNSVGFLSLCFFPRKHLRSLSLNNSFPSQYFVSEENTWHEGNSVL